MMRLLGGFLVFMYALGAVCTLAVVPEGKSSRIYEHAWTELGADVLLMALLLWAIGGVAKMLMRQLCRKYIRHDIGAVVTLWLKRLFYAVAYAVAVADVFCFVKFDSTLTPTMLLLVGETNSGEAGEFLRSFVGWDVLSSRVGWVLALMLLHLAWSVAWRYRSRLRSRLCLNHSPIHNSASKTIPSTGRQLAALMAGALLMGALLTFFLYDSWDNKRAFHRLMSYERIGEVEHELTETKTCARLYLPLYRLAFAVRANQLAAKQTKRLVEGVGKVEQGMWRAERSASEADSAASCIVLIIGESYNKWHSQLYGYEKTTTPRQAARQKKGELVAWSDVVAPWNLTSFVFKHLFSLYCVGDSGEWCDYPLFPQLFRQAGFRVTFLTNQFLPQAREAVYDFSGGFFLNHPQLSKAMFDKRNDRLYYFDEGLLNELPAVTSATNDTLADADADARGKPSPPELYIVHLKGQHVDYRTRYPRKQAHFCADDYDRPDLKPRERQIVAHYDNATLYNDSVVDQVLRHFEQRNAVAIYVPDHGEEVYGEGVHFCGRMHSTEITSRLAREEFCIPFWCWGSDSFRQSHAVLWQQLVEARHKPFMTDALPFLLLHLAGIKTAAQRQDLNVLSSKYNGQRPRLLKKTTDYNKLQEMGNEK